MYIRVNMAGGLVLGIAQANPNRVAVCGRVLQYCGGCCSMCSVWQCVTVCGSALQHTTSHCYTLQHTATHCNTLQHTATYCNTLQHTATQETC